MLNNRAIPKGMSFIPLVNKAIIELSGGVGGIDLKPIILGFIFFKYVSKYVEGNPWNKVIDNIESSELMNYIYRGFSDVADEIKESAQMFESMDLENEKLGSETLRVEKIRKVIKIINQIQQEDEHCLGNVYQYLLSFFASSPGRLGGEYYTPATVSKLMTLITLQENPEPKRIYDPTCGSGSLLMSLYKLSKCNPEIYGQEINKTTCSICFGNMFLNGVSKYSIRLGNTLEDPKHMNIKFDAIICNPPFSSRWIPQNDLRFKDWPELSRVKADFAFLLHCVHSLDNEGVITIVMPPGVLHRRAEREVRKALIEKNLLACVIQLAENLFLNTSTGIVLLVLKNNKQDSNVLFIDARETYTKHRRFNILTQENIEEILDTYKIKKTIPGESYLATIEEIRANDYLIAVPKYVDAKAERFASIDFQHAKQIHDTTKKESKKQIKRLLLTEVLDMRLDRYNYGDKYELIEYTAELCNELKNWVYMEYKFRDLNEYMTKQIDGLNEEKEE